MAIEQISLPADGLASDLWRQAALQTRQWLNRQGLSVRDAVVLLPYAALMAPARAGWSAIGGWQPRIETTLTLAGSLGPAEAAPSGACSGDATQDALTAGLMLRRLGWGAEWAQRDPAGFARIVDAVVDAAKVLREAALARAPERREAFWCEVRAALPAAAGPAGVEAALLQAAVEWAALSASAISDRLYALRPSAWVAVRVGGTVPAAEALLGHADTPSLLLNADPPSESPFDAVAAQARVERLVCDDFETEAQAAAATIFEALNAGRTPVALVALDRELVRRVRALLARERVPLVDETGWLLATTRPAAAIVALLRAARPGASEDTLLEWLKTWPPAAPAALESLEGLMRGRRQVRDRAGAQALKLAAQAHLQPLADAGSATLAQWLERLLARLQESGSYERLLNDDAGEQVLAALGFPSGASWQALAHNLRLDLAGFTAWVERTLEAQPFLPLPDEGAQLVLTPLTRAFGRPFAQVVVPGADHVRLGAIEPAPTLISESLAARLGLETVAVRRERQRLALAQLLRAPRVTLLRRRRDDEEPLAESPDVEWLLLARARALRASGAGSGAPDWPLRDWQPGVRNVPLQPVSRPLPVAADALPAQLSASRLDALRDCPYRFFSRAVLRLDEAEELDGELAKRDYGTWLHAVLHRFHAQRDSAVPGGVALMAAADHITAEQGLEAAELLPFRASFDTFAPRYLEWLAEREGQGWHWRDGEADRALLLLGTPEQPELTLRGVIDRIDAGPGGALQVLDYKTSSTDSLKRKVANPLEDTQLAFYATLLGSPPDLGAAYVSLDDAEAPQTLENPAVFEAAQQMLGAVADEWRRLQQGAPLPALGEGLVCDSCEARGLCRRDHWSAA